MKLTWHKWLAATLVLTTAVVPATGASAITDTKPYQDLASADGWAQTSIQQARDLGLMNGDGNGKFRPIDSITREEVAVVFARTLQMPTPTVSKSTFHDVDSNGWSHAAIEALAAAGLMTGDGDGVFRPDEMVTREEMAVLLVKAAGLQASAGDNLAIADRDAVSPWARGYVQAAMEAGLLRGDGTNFHPRSRAMRQEVAAMAINLYQKLSSPKEISSIGAGAVVIGGITYQVGSALQGVLNPSNAAVLKGARVQFEADGQTLTKLTYLELNTSGQAATSGKPEFSGNLVLDGKGSAIDGNLAINSDYVSLENLTVRGNFTITSALQNDFYSKNLQVTGQTNIRGGDSNTVVFEDGMLHQVQVAKEDVRVETKGTTKVEEVVVSANAAFTADASVTIPKLTLGDKVTRFALDAVVQQVEVSNKNAKLSLGSKSKIEKLTIPEGAKVEELVSNYGAVQSAIAKIEARKANGSTVAVTPTVPAAGGGGAVGGGGGGGSTPTPAPGDGGTPEVTEAVVQNVRGIAPNSIEVTFDKPLQGEPSIFEFAITHNVFVSHLELKQGTTSTYLLYTSFQAAGQTYSLSYKGKNAGKTWTGVVPQIAAKVYHEDGSTATSAIVTLMALDEPYYFDDVSIDQEGNYGFTGLKEGVTYSLMAWSVDNMYLPSIRQTFTFSNGVKVPNLVLRNVQARGQVLTADGKPAVQAHMFITGPNEFTYLTYTDENGMYSIAGLEAGAEYFAQVYLQGTSYDPKLQYRFTYTQGAAQLPIIQLVPSNLTGTVEFPAGVSSGYVAVTLIKGTEYKSDAIRNLYFLQPQDSFSATLEDGTYTIFATYIGDDMEMIEASPIQVVVKNGEVSPSNVILRIPSPMLKGKVTYDGRILVGGRMLVELLDANRQQVFHTEPNSEGKYLVTDVPEGNYILSVTMTSPWIYNLEVPVTLTKGKVTYQDVDFPNLMIP